MGSALNGSMRDVITAVYEITAEDAAGRAALVAVEQSHELPTELAPANAVRDSLAHVRTVAERPGRPALVTVDYPADLSGGELGQLLVLLLGNVSLQDGVRLVDVTLPASLAGVLPGPRLGVPGIRALVGEPEGALLATALKPVGMTIDRAPELLDAYGPDTLFLVGGDLRRGGDPRRGRRATGRRSQKRMNAAISGSRRSASRSASLGSTGRSRTVTTAHKKPNGSSSAARN